VGFFVRFEIVVPFVSRRDVRNKSRLRNVLAR
jgi:hypothetical protein